MANFFSKFFGRTIGDAASFGIGSALERPLEPLLQELSNETWTTATKAGVSKPIDPETLAEGVAQGQVTLAYARTEAAKSGITNATLDHMIDIANTGPPLGQAIEARRRGKLTAAQYNTALNRAGIETSWYPALDDLVNAKLSLADIANGVQQGHLPNDGILPPAVTGGVPFDIPLTQVAIDPTDEAAAWGIDKQRLQVQTNLAGLPPGDQELLAMWNRGIITEDSVDAGIREGHRKTKWIPAVKELRHAVLHATDYAGLRIRGWITAEQSYVGGALTGYSREQMDLLFLNRGRPATTHQVFIGLRRGGTLGGSTAGIDPAFLKSVQESDIRPEYANLLWASRYTYPAAFVLRTLASSGDLTQEQTETILLYEGWEPTLAKTVSAKWAAGTATTQVKETAAHLALEYGSGHISDTEYVAALKQLGWSDQKAALEVDLTNWKATKKYRDKAIDKVANRFIGLQFSEGEARQALTDLGVPARAQDLYVAAWTLDRDDEGTSLSQSQVGKAYKKGLLTLEAATARLGDLGMLPADAALFLGSV